MAFSGGEFAFAGHAHPTQAAVQQAASRGLTLARLATKWEYLQPTLGGPLDATELGKLTTSLGFFAASGMKVVVEPHNYGDYKTADGLIHKINDPDGVVTNALFADFWTRLSTALLNNPAVYGYELMNEPRQLSGTYVPIGSDLVGANGFDSGIPANITVTNGTASWSTQPGRNGSGRTLAITAAASGAVIVRFTNVPMVSANEYEFHAYFKSATTSRSVHVGLLCYNSSGSLINANEQITGGFAPDGSWTIIQSSGNPLSGTTKVDVQFTIGSAAAGEVHYMDDLVVVRATTADAARAWEISCQAAVDAIRAVDPGKMLWIPVYPWQDPTQVPYSHPNGPWITGTGPVRYAGHFYLDYAGGGQYTSTFSADNTSAIAAGYTGIQDMNVKLFKIFTDWLTQYGARGVISEIGWPFDGTDQAAWQAIGEVMYQLCDAALLDVTYWSAGSYSSPANAEETTAYNSATGSSLAAVLPQAAVIEAHPSV